MNGMMPDKLVFDTNILIGFLKQHAGFSDLYGMYPDSDFFISEITEFELLSYWDMKPDEEVIIARLFQDLVIVPFSLEIKKLGVGFRRAMHTKTPDAIIAATAVVLEAGLITRDDKLLKATFPGYMALSY